MQDRLPEDNLQPEDKHVADTHHDEDKQQAGTLQEEGKDTQEEDMLPAEDNVQHQ